MKEYDVQPVTLPGKLPELLLRWYDQGHRSLPWRDAPTPYHVWVSEIMLQQTRVEAVKPYFSRFMEALPDIPSLARAEEGLLLKLWEGLGYYRRVRNLQRAAQIIMEQYGGEMPRTLRQIRELPGIGDYTAGAIASIAFGLPTPAVDGNVLRVLARVIEDDRDILQTGVRKSYAAALAALYPRGRCGDFTQSLMELGAVVCLPGGVPKCEICPLKELCLARLRGSTDILPVRSPKKPRRIEEMTVFILWNGESLGVRKRSGAGLLAGLWELPNIPERLEPEAAREALLAMGLRPEPLSPPEEARHIFTHVEWRMRAYRAVCAGEAPGLVWAGREQLKREIALPSAFRHWKL